MYSGGSVGGAAMINEGTADVVMNWSGGMHHAKKGEASGFCYINDIVLGILELLKTHQRVLYVDIDIHHGDGVEEAFYTTDRVMTVSFHKYGDFFPGTGAVGDVGHEGGKHYAVNVPLMEGMDDDSYRYIFEPIMTKVLEMYQPSAIVVCGGADSLSGDKLGCFNLSMQGHSHCIEFLSRYGAPLMVLGGGGYTMRNVARCWCYETGQLLGIDLDDNIPEAALREYDYYMDTHKLRIQVSNMKNGNTRESLDRIRTQILANLAELPPVPSAHMAPRPPKHELPELPEQDPDVRGGGQAYEDRRVRHDNDYDTDDEEVGGVKAEAVDEEAVVREPTVAVVDVKHGAVPSEPMELDAIGENGAEREADAGDEGVPESAQPEVAEPATQDATPLDEPVADEGFRPSGPPVAETAAPEETLLPAAPTEAPLASDPADAPTAPAPLPMEDTAMASSSPDALAAAPASTEASPEGTDEVVAAAPPAVPPPAPESFDDSVHGGAL